MGFEGKTTTNLPPTAAFDDLMGAGEREEKSRWTKRDDSFMVETVYQDRLHSEIDRLNTTPPTIC